MVELDHDEAEEEEKEEAEEEAEEEEDEADDDREEAPEDDGDAESSLRRLLRPRRRLRESARWLGMGAESLSSPSLSLDDSQRTGDRARLAHKPTLGSWNGRVTTRRELPTPP